jgi:hypothetical protein
LICGLYSVAWSAVSEWRTDAGTTPREERFIVSVKNRLVGVLTGVTALSACAVFASSGVAVADNIQDSINASGQVTLVAGSSTGGTATVTVVGNNSDHDPDDGCNWDLGETPLVLDVVTPPGVMASPDPLSITTCGTDHTVTFTASASAVGGTATVFITSSPAGDGTYKNQVEIPITVNRPSNTKPTVSVVGVTDGASYEIGSVPTPSCNVADAEDGSPTVAVVIDGTLSHGLGTQTASCSYTDKGGLSASASVTFSVVDKTAPEITGTAAPAANAKGWNNTDVIVTWSCTDTNGSGVDTFSGPETLSADKADQSATGTCTDNAGNTATKTVDNIDIDKTKPVITGTATPAPNTKGWNNTDVTVTWSCTDTNGSGVDTFSGPQTLDTDGEDQSATGTCTDVAGNTATATVDGIDIDKTAPTLTGLRTPAANEAGWNNTDVTVHWNCTDSISGLGSVSSSQTFSTEGKNQSANGTCTDVAGNSVTKTVDNIDIDKTAPKMALTGGPTGGATYYFGFVPSEPECLASDELSGLDRDCDMSGYSNALGTHTMTVFSTDHAGNRTESSITYTVNSWSLRGFYQPVDMNGVLNTVKNGSTVPLKFEVFAGTDELKDPAFANFTVAPAICTTGVTSDDIEFTTSGQTTLRYDSVAGQFIQNWQTPKKPGNCYKVTMTTDDGSSLSALFKLK